MRDRFDDATSRGRVGAHRIIGKPRRFWVYLVGALVGIVVLTGAGVTAVVLTDGNFERLFSTQQVPDAPTPVPKPEVVAALDPAAPLAVLNGTSTPGFGFVVDSVITENQWGNILFTIDAEADDVETTTVYYVSVADKAAALGLAEQLGGAQVQLAREYSVYGARLVVVLGADYAGPGSELLQQTDIETSEQPTE